jgi:hypothetical protein
MFCLIAVAVCLEEKACFGRTHNELLCIGEEGSALKKMMIIKTTFDRFIR